MGSGCPAVYSNRRNYGYGLMNTSFPFTISKDFNKLSKAFKCVATDVSSGEAVVLDSGELVTALRASMAIPSVFTAVNYNGRKFIDGGIVRNFPVVDAKTWGRIW